MQLYPDQSEIMGKVRGAMARSKSVLLQSPTGSGKTMMAMDMVIGAVSKGKRMLFVVPRRDLLEQTSKTFFKHDIPHSFVAAGKTYNPNAQVFLGMMDTMARRLDKLPDVDVAVFDETHFGAKALGDVITRYKDAGSWVVGLSATPWKMNGQGLGVWYDTMVEGKSIRWLIDNKRLSDYRYFCGHTVLDFSGVKMSGGDYAAGEIAAFMESKNVIVGDCVHDYKIRCMGKLHVTRCTSIKHSQMTAEAFRAGGVPAMHVDGTTAKEEKQRIFKAFARREIMVLTFAELLSFGFDLSQASGMDVCIESASDMKPTKSLAGQMQFWGRALRYKPYPAIFNDHVQNYTEHGLPCFDREWTLEGRRKKKKREVSETPTKTCPECHLLMSAAIMTCQECGHVFDPPKEKEVVNAELTEITREQAGNLRSKLTKQQYGVKLRDLKTFEDIEAMRKEFGYKRGWSFYIAKSKGIATGRKKNGHA